MAFQRWWTGKLCPTHTSTPFLLKAATVVGHRLQQHSSIPKAITISSSNIDNIYHGQGGDHRQVDPWILQLRGIKTLLRHFTKRLPHSLLNVLEVDDLSGTSRLHYTRELSAPAKGETKQHI